MKKTKNMSPLIIVGILFSSALADVSHVLSGAAHPPANPSEVNSLVHKNAFQTGNPQDFWWMASNSPLKQAYDYYKKCSSKGDCLPPVNAVSGSEGDKDDGSAEFGPINVKSNPFLNGAYQSGSVSSSASFSSSGCSACASGSGTGSASGSTSGGGVAAFHSGTKIDITNNPFLNGQFAIAGNGEKVKNENGFLGVQPKKPGFATTHPLSNKKPFATSPPIGQQSFVLGGGELPSGVECKGQGTICVVKSQCVNGIVSKDDGLQQVRNDVQYCNEDTEVCCRLANAGAIFNAALPSVSGKGSLSSSINGLADITAGKSSVTGSTLKFSGGAGTSPGQIQVLAGQPLDVKPQINYIGESGAHTSASTSKPVRDISLGGNNGFPATADYSNVQFDSNVRFASTIQGPAYLPPIGTPSQPDIVTYQPSVPTNPPTIPTNPPLCPSGTFLGPSGICERPRIPSASCPFGTIKKPDGRCEGPEISSTLRPCPPGTILTPFGSCEASTTPSLVCPPGTIRSPSDSSCTSPTPRPCPPGTFLTATGSCEGPRIPSTTPRISCPYGTIERSDGSCESPTPSTTPVPPCPVGTIQRFDGSCERPTPTPSPSTPRACPPGTFLTASGSCQRPTPICPFGTIERPDGSCERPTPTTSRPNCPFGSIQKPDGSCERPEPPVTTSRPNCPFGSIQRPDGSCERPEPPVTTAGPNCPFGTVQRPDGSCANITPPTPRICPPGTFLTASGSCESPTPTCPFGTIQRPDGSCERPTPIPSTPRPCPAGTILSSSGLCESPPKPSCPFGTVQNLDGTCERPGPPPTPRPCPPGTFLTSSGLCESPKIPTPKPICPPGTIQSPSGVCEYPVVTSTTPGYVYPKPCPPGTYKTPAGLCERPVPTPRPCPFGTYLTPSGSCETPPRPSTPKPPPRPFETTINRDYLPPVTPTQPSSTAGYIYSTPTPKFEYPSSSLSTTPQNLPTDKTEEGSSIRDQYRLPGKPTTDNTQESGNVDYVTVSPTRLTPTRPSTGPPTRPPTRPPLTRPPYNNNNIEQNNAPPVGCAAALKCVQEIYCTVDGFVSPVPVVLTKEQELSRAPTTECKDLESGIIGKCCRDPNYKDPWPSANLVNGVDDGQYKEDNLYGQHNILGSNRLTRSFNVTNRERAITGNSGITQGGGVGQISCGKRNYDTKPLGTEPLEANFAEYPWQAMILRDSNRSLLCGGAIIRSDAVLTTAHCVEGLDTSDVLIKGGEWKLGIDEEPLPFQIVKVAAILRHPTYKEGSHDNDLAILVLREKLRFTKNVGSICLPQPNQAPASKCVVTGWGKRILQLHAKGAIMHHIDVSLLDEQTCKQSLEQNFQNSVQNHSPNTLCGVSKIDQCKVDYGSALACSDNQQQYTLYGIYSWDTGCKQEGQIGGYVTPDVQWIESTLGKSLKQLKRLEREYLLKSRS